MNTFLQFVAAHWAFFAVGTYYVATAYAATSPNHIPKTADEWYQWNRDAVLVMLNSKGKTSDLPPLPTVPARTPGQA